MSHTIQGKDSSNKISTKASGNTEQQFAILPHPAVGERLQTIYSWRNISKKTNDPRDLEPSQPGAGLTSNPEIAAHHAHGPYVPNKDLVNSLEKPAVSDESLPL